MSTSETRQLCEWISSLSLDHIPQDRVTRAKYLILDGLACLLIGAHLPWSEDAVKGIFSFESSGPCSVFGWERVSLLNSTFLQGFELDDYHREAPIHSNSIVLPALFAALEHCAAADNTAINGPSFLLSTIVGYETGPRVGQGVYGGEVLGRGWHSGAIFGPAAAAAASSKLFGLSADQMEDALGIACTQAGGLMSAQYESSVKRMQHGFATRNGLFAALMARSEYSGIKQVLERPYGGFLSVFSQGNGKEPAFLAEKVVEKLGEMWEMDRIVVKPYATMAATHGTIDCVIKLQENYPEVTAKVDRIKKVTVEMSTPAWKKGGWVVKRPLTPTGAQMSCVYAAAMQLLEGQVQPAQFGASQMEREDVWTLMEKIECVPNPDWDKDMITGWYQRIYLEVEGDDGETKTYTDLVEAPRGNGVPLTNEEILTKWRRVTEGVIDPKRRATIEKLVLSLEDMENMEELAAILYPQTSNVLA
ncbi:hypothetical protein AWENTII_009797 [Aspergillus wentii]